jgi:hypothetical protein
MRRLAALFLLLALATAARAAAAQAGAVGPQDLFASEAWWPYRATLVQDWTPGAGGPPLRKGTRGVLIRVETPERARVDFGRAGLYELPIAATDLAASADRIRRGELAKAGPNFVVAIGARLLDPEPAPPLAFAIERVRGQRRFLCVFADPDAAGFDDLARGLAPLAEREGVQTILFPQTRSSDAAVAEALRARSWRIPFVAGHLSEAYTRTLLPANATPPALLLQTAEGRVLFASPWRSSVVAELEASLAADAAASAATAEAKN